MKDPKKHYYLYKYKGDAMSRLAQLARHGYTRWTSGECDPSKALRLMDRFNVVYKTDMARTTRSRAKARGEATAHFVGWRERKGKVYWWLMVAAEGDADVCHNENLKDGLQKKSRLTFRGYELVRVPRPEQKKISWTWRMTCEEYSSWERRIRDLVRLKKPPNQIRQVIWSLSRVPGFAPVRTQAYTLHKLLRNEWKRIRSAGEELPARKKFYVAYRRFQEAKMIDATTLTKTKIQRAEPTEPQKKSQFQPKKKRGKLLGKILGQ